MGNLPFRRLFISIGLVVLFGSACCYVACRALGESDDGRVFAALGAVMLVTIGVPLFFVTRWWLRVARAAGVPLVANTVPNMVRNGLLVFAFTIGAVVLEFELFSLTGSRVWQCAVSALAIFPLGLIVARYCYGTMFQPKPQEAPSLRMLAFMNCVLPLLFGANLVLQMRSTSDTSLSTLHELDIAAYLTLIPILPITAYYSWQRYLRARASANVTG